MKILKEGKLKSPKAKPTFEYRGICTTCKTKVQASDADVKTWPPDGNPIVECPLCHGDIECKQKVKVNPEEVTPDSVVIAHTEPEQA